MIATILTVLAVLAVLRLLLVIARNIKRFAEAVIQQNGHILTELRRIAQAVEKKA